MEKRLPPDSRGKKLLGLAKKPDKKEGGNPGVEQGGPQVSLQL